MFVQNKYTRWYMSLMQSRQLLQREGYQEKHHIIPRSLGGTNERSNIVRLTAREHFIAHLLLTKMLDGKALRKMQCALMYMEGRLRTKGMLRCSSRIFHMVKEASSAANKRRHSAATRKKISDAKTGIKPNLSEEQRAHRRALVTGVKQPPRSEQWRERQRQAQKHKVMSAQARQKISESVSGANNPRAKVWMLEREDGTTFEVKALKPWCRERGLSFDAICRRDGRWFNGIRLRI